MLILTRKLGESVVIEDNIVVTVSDIKNGQIKLGISAPKDLTVNREEVVREIKDENVLSSASGLDDLTQANYIPYVDFISFDRRMYHYLKQTCDNENLGYESRLYRNLSDIYDVLKNREG